MPGDPLVLQGKLDVRTLADVGARLGEWRVQGKSRTLDLAQLEALDTPGALLLRGLRDQGVKLVGARPQHQALLDLVFELRMQPLPQEPKVSRGRELVTQVGKGAHDAWQELIAVIAFVGEALHATLLAFVHPGRLRPASISRHVREAGINALPIVGAMAVMIAVVIGYQGLTQLRAYGSEEFAIDLVAVSMLREMGVLITAIMVAGRSGSAFAAEIGVMRAREEVDALRVMGIDPVQVLVVPRVIGLAIVLPLLTFFADVMGLLGGALVSFAMDQVTLGQYLERARLAVDGSDLFVGLAKAPIFALVIATVGCMHGLRVRGSAASVGSQTTRAVVKAIFLVIVLDALFSVFFERVGL